MAPKSIVLAFDVYGTLLSTESIAKKLSSHIEEDKAKTIAATWRKYQLEYTWRANSMGLFFHFDQLTRRAMRHALLESNVQLDEGAMNEMMNAYDSLSTFPDVQTTLENLKGVENVKIVIFSNGTRDMVSNLLKNSPDLSANRDIFQELVLVEECRKYKPAAEVYWHLAERMGKDHLKAESMAEVWVVSGNPFDVVGARGVGMNAIWVDRAGTGWQDCFGISERSQPTEIVRSLDGVAAIAKKIADGNEARS